VDRPARCLTAPHPVGKRLEDAFWSPDGQQIAFTHWADLTFPPPDIYTSEADGTGAPVNVTNSPGIVDLYSAWQSVPDRD
jgi:Tol biopolymer transport system component